MQAEYLWDCTVHMKIIILQAYSLPPTTVSDTSN